MNKEEQRAMLAMEREANAFAMELLMPFDLIAADCRDIDLCDDQGIEKLARKYRVPNGAMATRINEVRSELADRFSEGEAT